MSDGRSPRKRMSLVQNIKQKLIDNLIAASDRAKDSSGNIDFEKLREERLAVLGKFDREVSSVADTFNQLAVDVAAAEKFYDGCPRKLDQLLVSTHAVPFESLDGLDRQFGPLERGYCYRYLAPATRTVSTQVANTADNVIRLPSTSNSLVSKYFDSRGDEIPGGSLSDWLNSQPAATYRIWTMRILSLCGILRRSDLPAAKRSVGTVPSSGLVARGQSQALEPMSAVSNYDPKIAKLVKKFRQASLLHYDGEDVERDASVLRGVREKKDIVNELKRTEPHGIGALLPLLDDRERAVRVSAATYVLRAAPQYALPVLQEFAGQWPGDESQKHSVPAALHAARTIWMYEDGDLDV